jgi:type II secretory pathway pseudopilin PulG
VLLVLIFMMAMIAIGLAIAAPRIAQSIKREREVEMIHRGEQYARAVKRYYKKFGRYPTRIEELENTNNLRFLRKRYKDPLSQDGKWRLVRYGEVQLGQGPNSGLGSVPSQPAGGIGQTPTGATGDSGTGSGTGTTGNSGGGTGLFSNPSSGSGSGSGSGSSLFGSTGTGSGPGAGTGASGPGSGTGGASSSFGSASGSQQFGGGPFLGVASSSEKKGIHEFNNKKQYNQWLFVYDPNQDRGGLIKGPYNPKAFVGQFGGQGQQGQGQPGQTMPQGLGGQNGLGGQSGFGAAGNPTPAPPQTNPQ